MSSDQPSGQTTINAAQYYKFYEMLLQGEVHIAHKPPEGGKMEEGRLIRSDNEYPGSGLRIIQLHGDNENKPQLEGNPANSALILPGGTQVAVPIHDKENDKIHYAFITIPLYFIDKYEGNKPLIAEAMIDWDSAKF